MPYYKFNKNDLFYNRIKAHPKVEFLVYGGRVYHQNENTLGGAFSSSHKHIPDGHVSLYELNIDQPDRSDRTSTIYPFVTKQGTLGSFKTISTSNFNTDFQYGDKMVSSYPLSASIQRYYYNTDHEAEYDLTNIYTRPGEAGTINRVVALKNVLNYYSYMSRHYAYSSSLDDTEDGWNKGYQKVNLISIPSIFYGSSIKKGSIELNFYVTGTLIGQLRDENRNGELIQTKPVDSLGSGNVGGIALYNEGFLVLTGAWDMTALDETSAGSHTEEYLNDGSNIAPTWLQFAAGANDGYMIDDNHTASSFTINYRGINYIPTITMLVNAPKGELNHSNNPTYISSSQGMAALTGSTHYKEIEKKTIKNIVSGAYTDITASFQKQTFISKIGIYDDEKNLIAIAKLATPIKKTAERDITFKLKLDI